MEVHVCLIKQVIKYIVHVKLGKYYLFDRTTGIIKFQFGLMLDINISINEKKKISINRSKYRSIDILINFW